MYEQERPFDYPGSSQGAASDETNWFRLVILIEDEYGNQLPGSLLIDEGEDLDAMKTRLGCLQSVLGGDLI